MEITKLKVEETIVNAKKALNDFERITTILVILLIVEVLSSIIFFVADIWSKNPICWKIFITSLVLAIVNYFVFMFFRDIERDIEKDIRKLNKILDSIDKRDAGEIALQKIHKILQDADSKKQS